MSAAPLLLRVVAGAAAGTAFRVSAEAAVVGRSPDCAISIDEPSLSRRHFEMWFETGEWRLRDLESRNGVFVNGQRVREGMVRAGDEIQAGDMMFRVEASEGRLSELPREATTAESVEHTTTTPIRLFPGVVPTLSAEAPPPATGTLFATLLSSLRQNLNSGSRLYALIDGAQAFELAFSARLMGHDLYTIFSGELAEVVAQVGPCLVVIGEPSAFVQRWAGQIGTNAGVLIESAADVDAVGAHLRSIFVATDEEGQEYFFRFYDPRVLRTFLPTCRDDELREFFGPISSWIVETEDGTAFTRYQFDGIQLKATSVRPQTLP